MGEFDTERSNYVTLHETPPQPDRDGVWTDHGTSISLGFVATAVLISMFVIMAIFEYLFRPNASFRLTQHTSRMPANVHKVVDPQQPVSYFLMLKSQSFGIYICICMVQVIKAS